jgi:hypothetical protein
MTYCSYAGQRDPVSYEGNAQGFDPVAIYKTYDEYAGDPERAYLEYFMRDVYAYCGYDFHYYDGSEMDLDKLKALVGSMEVEDRYIRETWKVAAELKIDSIDLDGPKYADATREEKIQTFLDEKLKDFQNNRLEVAVVLMQGLRFINKKGQSLKMMPKLELDPELLEQELYH